MGFLVSAIGNSTIRLAPPLIITKQQAASFVKALDKILKEVSGPKTVFDKIKNAFPSKKQVKDSASKISSAKIDRLDTLDLSEPKPAAPAPENDDD